MLRMKNEFGPVTPGEMLKEEFLAEYRLSQNQLAKAIGISPNRITEIVTIADGSAPIPRCVWDSISATARNSG